MKVPLARAVLLAATCVLLAHSLGWAAPTLEPGWVEAHAEMLQAEMSAHRFGFVIGNQHSGLCVRVLHYYEYVPYGLNQVRSLVSEPQVEENYCGYASHRCNL